jgi:4-carboxymuconolactone decarboxylase
MSTDEPRLGPLPVERWNDEIVAALEDGRGSLLAPELREALGDRDLERLSAILPNAITTMFHHPPLAGKFLAFVGVFLSDPALPRRWRELAVLRVAWRSGSTYEWLQHVRMAPRFEISSEEIEALSKPVSDSDWSPIEAALITATDQLIDRYSIDDATWTALSTELDERQLLELPFVVGAYLCQAMVYNGLRIQLDPGLLAVEAPVVPRPDD